MSQRPLFLNNMMKRLRAGKLQACSYAHLVAVVPPVIDRLTRDDVMKPDHVVQLTPAMFTYPRGEAHDIICHTCAA